MTHSTFSLRSRVLVLAMLVGAAMTAAPQAVLSPALAAEKFGNSLDFVPADAAFYSSMLRNREQLEIAGKSKAWQKLTSLPLVQMGLAALHEQLQQPGSPLPFVQQLLESPENQQLLELAGDMFSHEVFIYGDGQLLALLQKVNAAANSARFGALAAGPRGGNDDVPRQVARALLASFSEKPELLKSPNLVIGFKIADAAAAKAQLKRLELVAGMALQQAAPQLKARLKRAKAGEGEFLTFTVDGSLVPWDEIPVQEIEQQPGEFAKVIDQLRKATLTVSVGTWRDYMLVSLGSSTDHLASLGKGKLLADAPHLKPVLAVRDKKLVNVGYMSKQLMSLLSTSKEDLDQLSAMVMQMTAAVPIPVELRKRLADDAEKLSADLKRYVPEPGDAVSYSLLTDFGFESVSYNWGQNLSLDGTKPLPLLDHLGGAPLVALVGRSKYSPDEYPLLVKWLKVGYGYFEDFAVPQMGPAEQQIYQDLSAFAKPLLKRLDEATGKMLIPALADGQGGLVIDAKITSKRWHNELPETPVPLPMLEIALVAGVSDAKLLEKAIAEYKGVADEVLKKIGEIEPGAIPPGFQIPPPKVTAASDGNIYSYPLPAELGLDAQLAPNAGLSKSVLVLSLSPKQTERMLKSRPLPAGALPAKPGQRLAAAGYCDWAGIVDAVGPWVEIGLMTYTDERRIDAKPAPRRRDSRLFQAGFAKPTPDEIAKQVHQALELLKVLRTIGSVTYVEADALVTRTHTRFKDAE